MTVATEIVSALRRDVRGEVIAPEDATYDAVRVVEAALADLQPLAVVRVRDAADVRAVVDLARDAGVELAVRGGGHSTAGHGTIGDGIVLDTSGLKDLQIDLEAGTATAGAGLTAGEYARATTEHGLSTGFGDTAAVGISGLTLGGGMGLLSRKYGMTIDSLQAAEVVTADGQLRVVDAEHEPDLFWALRGGGSNFGVVTSLTFRLVDVSETTGGTLVLPAEPGVLAGFLAAADQAPPEVTTIVTVMPCPPVPFVPAELHGRTVLFCGVVHVGPVEEAERALAPFRELAEPIADLIATRPYADLLGWEELPRSAFATRTQFLDHVDEAAAATIIDGITASPAPVRLMQLRVLGGALAEVDADATAFGFRDRRIVTYQAGMVSGPEDLPAAQEWVDRLSEAVDTGDRAVFLNFLGEGTGATVEDAYPPATFERLRRVKDEYDPTNLFRRNHNIPPAPQG